MADDEIDFEAASKRSKNKVNIFDDDISFEAARKIIKSSPINCDDEDEDDTINFDGTPSVKYTNRLDGGKSPKTPMPDLSSLAMPVTSPASRTSLTSPDTPMSNSSSFGSISSAVNFGHNRSKSLTMGAGGGDKGLSRPTFSAATVGSSSSLQDIDEFGGGLKKQLSSADIEKMQQEIQSLKRSLLTARRDRWVKLPVADTLRRIIKGEVFSLEMYRSLEDKLELLDKATAQHDGNAVTAAVLFLQRTVTSKIFNREIKIRPVAANHYLNYLKDHFDHIEYINTLIHLGRTEEAAIYKYKLALKASDVNTKIGKVRECLRENFKSGPDASLVEEHVDLLERQRPIDESDANLEAAGRTTIFRDFPRKRSLIGMSVVTTLYYCCLYHYDLLENNLACPSVIRKRHQISDKQYTWTAIGARAKLRQWKDIEALLTTKGWFGGTKLKAVIGFDKVVAILQKNNAPPDILEKYLAMIDDLELRLNLAKKFSCPKAIVDTLVAMKNRPELEAYTAKLDRYSKEGLYANDVLNSSTIKWK